jgi:hypothetical protein
MALSIIPYQGDDLWLRSSEGCEDFVAYAVMANIAYTEGIFFTPEEARAIAKRVAARIVEDDE